MYGQIRADSGKRRMALTSEDISTVVSGFVAARQSNSPYQPPSAHPSRTTPLTIADAEAVQKAFVTMQGLSDTVVGYKSAANALPLQRALNLEGPIAGALFASGERAPDSIVDSATYRSLLLETELGFRLDQRVTSPLQGIAELRRMTTTCMAMIELADPGFGRVRFAGTDLIAANAASAGFIAGTAHTMTSVDVNSLTVRLSRDGSLLHEAQSTDLMGDQWQALLWLVNKVVALGYVIEPGQLLMTGALGGAHPAAPGAYLAEFGALGVLRFTIV